MVRISSKLVGQIPTPDEYMVFGTPGASMKDSGFSKKFGSSATKSGSKGEMILFNELRKKGGILPPHIPLMCSLRTPGYDSDIDFAVASGDKVLLIDAKMYRQDGGIYWNTKSDRTHFNRNFSRYKSRSGQDVTLSRSDIAAEEILSRKMKGTTVQSVVVFVSDPTANNAKPPIVLMKFPGEVKAVSMKNFRKFFVNYFGKNSGYNHVTHNNIKYLSSLCQ